MAFTTAKSSFELVTADQPYKCSGCHNYIGAGQPMLVKPFIVKKKEKGKTRLHNIESCYQDWESHVLNKLADNRENTGVPWKRHDKNYSQNN